MSKHSKHKPKPSTSSNHSTPDKPNRQSSNDTKFVTPGPALLHPTLQSTNLEFNLLNTLANQPIPKGSRFDSANRPNIGLMGYVLQADRSAYLAKHDQFPTDIDYTAYDRIDVNADQFKHLIDLANDFNPPTIFDLFEHPTLPEFVCHIADDYDGTTTICYKSTIVPNSILSLACLNCNEPCQAYIDAYISPDYKTTELACCLGLAVNSHYTVGTMCYESPNLGLNEKQVNAFVYNTSRFYLAVQLLLRERPEIIVQRSRQAMPLSSPKKSKKSKSRKVRYIKISYINDEDLRTFQPKRHHASPRGTFGVRGHWRHYKNGKNVWIGPYTKGLGKTEYQSKEYELPDLTDPTDHNH